MATFLLSTIFAVVVFAAVIAFFLRVMILEDRSEHAAGVDTGTRVGLHPADAGASVAVTGNGTRLASPRTAERVQGSRAA
jgi:hypothetical protein